MFVSESTLFMGIQVQILSSEGILLITQLDPNSTVESIKQVALQHFYPTEASTIKSEQFRVIHPASSRTLNDTHAINEERVQENDILLFIKKRETKVSDSINDQEMKAPTLAEINNATKTLEKPRSSSRPTNSGATPHSDTAENAVDFQLELRKILISLVSVMSTLLHGNSDAELICKEMHSRLKHRLALASKPHEGNPTPSSPPEVPCTPMGIIHGLAEAKKREFRPNQKALESLREMGFSNEDIVNALRSCKNNKDAACEWLLAGRRLVVDDVDVGLEQNSHLFQALVTNPTIRLGLNSPKTLLAFLGILESPSSANLWLTDSDTSPVLSAIFKIYHSEKHASTDL